VAIRDRVYTRPRLPAVGRTMTDRPESQYVRRAFGLIAQASSARCLPRSDDQPFRLAIADLNRRLAARPV